ncbi:MAG: bifunctional phosphopantothenoylcysteine decarboxylase/phosphopantothenate--cysteine ligase CoaBC [Reichenbachiella sp.]
MEGKKILVGVCGSIAAYKSAHLTRLLVKAGAEVRIVMTESAKSFITPLTLSTLSKNPVASKFEKNDDGEWENHVDLGLWADAMIIAPATANSLAKLSNGICDNLLSAVYLSARCPVMIAPAMDLDMYLHPSTQSNIVRLQSYGNQIIEAEHGELASGLVGTGRMAEPEHITEYLQNHFFEHARFEGKKVVITAGPTYEKIDPVRFIGNHSSGKMGLAIAHELARQGAQVELVAGPGQYHIKSDRIRIHRVGSADEMFDKMSSFHTQSDIAIFAAAVADYKPASIAQEKIKKSDDKMTIEMVKNKDIAAELGKLKIKSQFHVGFALETENEEMYAQQKMVKKNFDLIILNSLNDKGAGFSHDTNKVTIFSQQQSPIRFDLKSKDEVATDIVNAIYEELGA